MALLDIDAFVPHASNEPIVSIPEYRISSCGKYAKYFIKVNIEPYTWTVERRYRDFVAFDEQRFKDRKASFLPPKKFIGNMDSEFLHTRRLELEKYIRAVMELELWLLKKRRQHSMSKLLAYFLDFQEYEIHTIVEDLSLRFSKVGERWLAAALKKPKYFEFTPIELHAITERIKLPEPTSNSESSIDIVHYVEFLDKVRNLCIRGARAYVGSSNIVCNSLPISLHFCNNLLALWIREFDVKMISGLHSIKRTCKRIVVNFSMCKISDLLLEPDYCGPVNEAGIWECVEDIIFSFNELTTIDDSICLLKNVVQMDLSHNNIKDIGYNLQHLVFLSELNLSHNKIDALVDWHLKLGNVKKLHLDGNRITSVEGLSRLFSLEFLDVSDNDISTLDGIEPIGSLPCLEQLILRENPIGQIVEYRTKVLELFGDRAADILLDNKKPGTREIDTVAVRVALKKAQLEKKQRELSRKTELDRRLRLLSAGDLETMSSRSV